MFGAPYNNRQRAVAAASQMNMNEEVGRGGGGRGVQGVYSRVRAVRRSTAWCSSPCCRRAPPP